jgi:hypothetical protein
MKQYIVMPAYTDNYHVIAAENGKVVSDEIIAFYELAGYLRALESQGYAKAYFLPEAKKELEEAELDYQQAKEHYKLAKDNALQISDEEASKVFCLKRFYEEKE